jgi:hypothetical protein
MQPQRNERSDGWQEDEGRTQDREHGKEAPENRSGEPGAEGRVTQPHARHAAGMRAKQDPALVGDTDQRSTD